MQTDNAVIPVMPDCWVVVKDGRIIGTHDESGHIDGLQAVRYVPAHIAQSEQQAFDAQDAEIARLTACLIAGIQPDGRVDLAKAITALAQSVKPAVNDPFKESK